MSSRLTREKLYDLVRSRGIPIIFNFSELKMYHQVTFEKRFYLFEWGWGARERDREHKWGQGQRDKQISC